MERSKSKMMTFKEFLEEGKFPGSPKRGSEMRADDQGVGVRAKRNKKNLPDERKMYHGNSTERSWKSQRKTQYK